MFLGTIPKCIQVESFLLQFVSGDFTIIVASDQSTNDKKKWFIQKAFLFFNKIEWRVVKVCNCIWCLNFILKMPQSHFDVDSDIIRRTHKMETFQGISANSLIIHNEKALLPVEL